MGTLADKMARLESLHPIPALPTTLETLHPIPALPMPIEAHSGVLDAEMGKHLPDVRKLNHDEARAVIALYRRHDTKSSIAAIPTHLSDDWIILEYPDGTHVAFNAEGWQ